jgi:hypothetical protein
VIHSETIQSGFDNDNIISPLLCNKKDCLSMARINIDDKLWSDARFDALKNLVGNELIAIGMVVKSFRIAQEYWKTETQLIPFQIWKLYNFDAMEIVGLALRRDNGVYIKGSNDQFDWLKKKQEAGKISAEIRRQKFGTAQPTSNTSRTPVEHMFENPRTPPEPPTPTLNLNTYTSNNCTEIDQHNKRAEMADAIVAVWNQTLTDVLPLVSRLTDKRRKHINAQLKKYQDIEHWRSCFEKVKASDFLTGKSSSWKCNFDWVLNENNRTKILEGNYDNKKQEQTSNIRWLE